MPKRAYLQPEDLARKSAMHTAYAGDGPVFTAENLGEIHSLVFYNGVARNVEEGVYRRFKDLGVCDVKRPDFEKEED